MSTNITPPDPNPWYIFENTHDFNKDGVRDNLWVEPDFAAKGDAVQWRVFVQLSNKTGGFDAPVAVKTKAEEVDVFNHTDGDDVSERETGFLAGVRLMDGDFDADKGWDNLILYLAVDRGADSQFWNLAAYMSGDEAARGEGNPVLWLADKSRNGDAADAARLGAGAKDAWMIRFHDAPARED